MKRIAAITAVLGLVVLQMACATTFSPEVVRSEIVRQIGTEPPSAFELNLGRMTLALARTAIGSATDKRLPLSGLDRFELAVYDLPANGRGLDFTRMEVRGWEPTVRSKTDSGSTVVLVRYSGDAAADLVLMAADGGQAIYARLAGRLSRDLPGAIAEAVATRGTEGVKQELMGLASSADPISIQ